MSEFKDARYNTLELLTMMDEGRVDTKWLVEMLLSYMSDDDVGLFMEAHELDERMMYE